MRNIWLLLGATGLLGLFSACGGDDRAPISVESGGSNAGKNGKAGSAGHGGSKPTAGSDSLGGAGGVEAGESPLAPTVIITSPAELSDPDEGSVLTGSEVTATCSATQSAAVDSSKVNSATVKLALSNAAGKVLEEKPGIPTSEANEYSAKFSLTEVPSGVVTFTCTAEDTSQHSATDSVSTFVDKGPIITILKPKANEARALSEPLDLDFTVEAAPLSDTDTKADVDFDSVTLEIVGQSIDLSDALDKDGHYRLQVDLANAKLFNPAPSGPIPIVIRAANERNPDPVVAEANEEILVDGAGPLIKITTPVDKAVVGGKVRLTFEATDAVSGVDPRSIVVAINTVGYPYDPASDSWGVEKNVYTFEFDSRLVKQAKVQLTVNVGATDKVGNVSTGASELLYLDNYPPVVDLDPFNIRTITPTPNAKCSSSFDPVGLDGVNDLDSVEIAGMFRALVVDKTNTADEFPIVHFAGTNSSTVRLYIEDDETKPLLVDTNDDGICDDVAAKESSKSIGLMPIAKKGAPLYIKDDSTAPVFSEEVCPTKEELPKPERLCTNKTSQMWQVIQDEYNNLPVIFGVSVTPDDECTGVVWELAGVLHKDGWVCAAVRAEDVVGNVGISRPLRVCLDDPARAGSPACATSSTAPPTCTKQCTPPARLGGDLSLWK